MITLKTYEIDGVRVLVGEATKTTEYDEMFELRKRIYREHGYTSSSHKGGSDVDEYDENRTCVYFVVYIEDKLVGSVRLIRSRVLPTQLTFDFKVPLDMKGFDPDNLAEISRLVVDQKVVSEFGLPYHLIMLILIDGIIIYSGDSDLYAGYSFVKTSLGRILSRWLHFPVHFVDNFTMDYRGELMAGYFLDKKDPPVPIYYLREEAERAIDALLKSKDVTNGKVKGKFADRVGESLALALSLAVAG